MPATRSGSTGCAKKCESFFSEKESILGTKIGPFFLVAS